MVSLLLAQQGIRRIDRYPSFSPSHPRTRGLLPNPLRDLFRLVAGRRSQNADKKRFVQQKQKGLPRHSAKEKKALIPITLPNFIYLEAEQMPGYEKFGKHEIVR